MRCRRQNTSPQLQKENKKLTSAFNASIRKLESIFREDAQQQVDVYKQNAMADYKELWSLREENQSLTEINQILKDELINILDKSTDPETREMRNTRGRHNIEIDTNILDRL